MFCPACGVATSEEQKFCRACGMHLEVVYHLVAEHAQAESVAPVLPEKRPAHQTVGRFLSVRGGALFIVLAFTLLLLLASADVPARLWNPLWSQLAMGAFGLIFAGLCLFRLPWPYRKLFTRLRRETTQLELIDTTKLPAEILASQGGSIAKHTTRNLDSRPTH